MLPAYNEGAALPHVLAELEEYLDDSYEVLVVDDGSTDDTAEVADSFANVRVVRHDVNGGKGVAIRTGYRGCARRQRRDHGRGRDLPGSGDQGDGRAARRERSRSRRPPVRARSMSLVNRLGNWLFNSLLAISHGLDGADHLTGLYAMRRDGGAEAPHRVPRLRHRDGDRDQGQGAAAEQAEIDVPYLPRVGEKKLRPWADGMRIFGRMVVLLLIYNPALTFIAPGHLADGHLAHGAILLSNGPVVTSYLGLSIHSYIVAALGVLAATS